MSLKISKDLELPLDAITQTFSILAMRRIGKTYTASVMAEEFVRNGLPFVALDPTGAWWGLRAGSDGKSEGLPVVIIGGPHGDVPLEFTAGKVIADLVVDHPGYYVLDLSNTESGAEQDRFAMDFAERLYRRKNLNRTPLHLFVDEADSFMPQRPIKGQERMLGAFEAIVRRGGIRGIGTTLITQRAAVINKNVLTQTDSLLVMQMNSSQDQDAMEDWIRRNGTKEESDTMMGSLASLPQGQAWFWSPGWMRVFKRIHIRARRTFNSSATPKAGEKVIVPQKLAPIDLDRLGKEITATIERAADNDPGVLKRKITELKHKVTKLEQAVSVPVHTAKPTVKIEKQEVPVVTAKQEKILTDAAKLLKEAATLGEHLKSLVPLLTNLRQEVFSKIERYAAPRVAHVQTSHLPSATKLVERAPVSSPTIKRVPLNVPSTTGSETEADPDAKLGKCEKSILRALRQYPKGRTVSQISVLSRYSSRSGSFKNSMGRLRSIGFISTDHPVTILDAGIAWLGEDWQPLPHGPDLIRQWLNDLSKCESAILKHLTEIYPEGTTPEELGQVTNYSPASGSFKNSLGRLRTLELVNSGRPIKASDNLFQFT